MNIKSRQNTSKETLTLNDLLDQMDLDREYSIQKQQNTHTFQVYMEYSAK